MTAKLDQDILGALTHNARLSEEDIALLMGSTVKTVSKAMRRMEDDGVILQYTTIVNEDKMPQMTKIRALIQLNVRPEKKKGFDALAKKISQYENVADVFLISGQFDLLLVVEGESLQEISFFVSDKLASLENVLSTNTYFILKKYKEKGVQIADKLSEKRLPVIP